MLEPLREQHADFLFEGLREPALYQFIPQEPPVDNDQLKERFMRLSRGPEPYGNELWLNWAVKQKFSSHYVGLIEATVDQNQGAHLAYFIFIKFWQGGYGSEACLAVINHLRERRGCKRVFAEVDTRNQGSIALLEKLGFGRVAFNAEADTFKGTVSDEYVYELRF
jgi:ribosomal-protein-alanine N-acetyltransferase